MKVSLTRGSVPLVVSFPHSGTMIPNSIQGCMTELGKSVPDTDWYLPRLYHFLRDLGVSIIAANFSRYVIDPNRPTDGKNLYPGQPTPALCPVETFAGQPIYLPGRQPDEFEIGRRTAEYWRHYHDDLTEELTRLKHEHGFAVVFDAHSIRSRVPRLFQGQLPDINIGTAGGIACCATLQATIQGTLNQQTLCTHVINGRFIGGHITRHYGKPDQRIHAVQLELSQRCYMDEETNQWNDEQASRHRPMLRKIVESILNWAGSHQP